MDLISLCPLPVAGVLWNSELRGWSITVVAKATFDLAPGELRLRRRQIALHRTDRHYDDEPVCSVYAPADLVPFKPRVDVMVVGHAYAPRGESVGLVNARLVVGESIDKTIRVHGTRTRDAANMLGPTAKFEKMPLRYERAPGGPGTANPVGMPIDGSSAGPRTTRQGTAIEADTTVLPYLEHPRAAEDDGVFAAFGPLGATWPTRKKKLGRHADSISLASWYEVPLPSELDLSFFNAAPDDQQLEALRADDTITLYNMHPKHAALSFVLPKLWPQAFLERDDGDDELMTMRCDTVWIDSDKNVCTLTWRGQMRVDRPERARCLVAATDNGVALKREDLLDLMAVAGIGALEGPPSFGVAIGLPGKQKVARGGRQLDVKQMDVDWPNHGSLAALSDERESLPKDSGSGDDTTDEVRADSGPSLLTHAEVVTISSDMLESVPPSSESGRHGPKIVKLVWLDHERVRSIRSQPGWQELLEPDPHHEDGSGRRRAQRDARDVHRVVVSAYPSSAADIEAAVAEAVGRHQEFESPLVLSAGELRLSFDELALLRATVAAAAPFVLGDPDLEHLIRGSRELLALPGVSSADGVAAELTLRIREAFHTASRALPPSYLEAQVQRMAVTERSYQRRELWGRRWLRAAFVPVGTRVGFTAYLPEEVARFLPLFERFFVRIIAQVDLREDQFETHPLALRVLALARVVASPLAFTASR